MNRLETVCGSLSPHSSEWRKPFLRSRGRNAMRDHDSLHPVQAGGQATSGLGKGRKPLVLMGMDLMGFTTVCMVRTDSVFHDKDALPVRENDEKIYAPDIVAIVAILPILSYGYGPSGQSQNTVSSLGEPYACEKCLCNLKGVRTFIQAFGDRTGSVLPFDGQTPNSSATLYVSSNGNNPQGCRTGDSPGSLLLRGCGLLSESNLGHMTRLTSSPPAAP